MCWAWGEPSMEDENAMHSVHTPRVGCTCFGSAGCQVGGWWVGAENIRFKFETSARPHSVHRRGMIHGEFSSGTAANLSFRHRY